MSFILKDRVQETTVTTGTGTVTLLGATQAHQSFSAAIGNSNTTTYLILSGNGIDWEVGVGTYTAAGNTLSRTTVLASSVGGAIPLAGTSLVSCTNPATQAGANGLLDQLFGSAQGTLIYRDASSWLGLAPGTSGNFLKTQGAGANPVWAAVSGGGGGTGGLFSGVMSALPTSAGTGLTTWFNQGTASVTDAASGVVISDVSGGVNLRCRTKTPPATPYSFSALVALGGIPTNFISTGIGWHDGTKLHTISVVWSGGWTLGVQKWTNSTTFSANDYSSGSGNHFMMWLKIQDDGTNAKFSTSVDGVSWTQIFSVAKSSGFLGSSGYTSIFVGGENAGNGQEAGIEILSWTQGT